MRAAVAARMPFGVTPYYLSLMHDEPEEGRDRAVRAQLLPPASCVREMRMHAGAQVYEFHPWDRHIVRREPYLGTDVPICEYLTRLAAIGENPEDYRSTWYYF